MADWSWLLDGVTTTRLRFALAPRTAFRIPDWPGSLLRGALGHALARRPEAHRALYEGRRRRQRGDDVVFDDVPRPYTLEWSPALTGRTVRDDPWEFDLVLLGAQASALAPAVAAAMEAAAERGLGRERVAHELVGVRVVGGEERPLRASGELAHLEGDRLTLDASTPLQVSKHVDVARRPTGVVLGRSLQARARSIAKFHGTEPPPPPDPSMDEAFANLEVDVSAARWLALERGSNRQGRLVPVPGLVGRVELRGAVAALRPLVAAALVLHAGRHVSLGHGRLTLVLPDARGAPVAG